jgi:hypothetical protein
MQREWQAVHSPFSPTLPTPINLKASFCSGRTGGPSRIIFESGNLRISSTCSSVFRASGKVSTKSCTMPTRCVPCPGKKIAVVGCEPVYTPLTPPHTAQREGRMERAYRLESGLLPLWPACARASEQNAQLWSQDHLVLIGLRSGNGRKSDDRTGERSAATEAQTLPILLGGRISGTEFTPRPWLADDDGFRWYKRRCCDGRQKLPGFRRRG